MRSSTPPWPGISAELSFTPAARFSIDSNRSPAMPATTSATPSERQHRRGWPSRGTKYGAGEIEKHRRGDESADRALDGFLRAEPRRQRTAPERAARVVLRRVADDDRRDQQQHRAAAAEHVNADERAERQADVDTGARRAAATPRRDALARSHASGFSAGHHPRPRSRSRPIADDRLQRATYGNGDASRQRGPGRDAATGTIGTSAPMRAATTARTREPPASPRPQRDDQKHGRVARTRSARRRRRRGERR